MFYKIVNKNCEVYQKLYNQLMQERQQEEENWTIVKEAVGFECENIFAYGRNQGLSRITDFVAFQPKNESDVDLKKWRRWKEKPKAFVPNRRTVEGKHLSETLSSLKNWGYYVIHDILKARLEVFGTFTVPFLEENNGILVLRLDDRIQVNNPDVIEITYTEAKDILKP